MLPPELSPGEPPKFLINKGEKTFRGRARTRAQLPQKLRHVGRPCAFGDLAHRKKSPVRVGSRSVFSHSQMRGKSLGSEPLPVKTSLRKRTEHVGGNHGNSDT